MSFNQPGNRVRTMTQHDFMSLSFEIMNMKGGRRTSCRSEKIRMRRFRSFFGTEPFFCAIAWIELEKNWNYHEKGVCPEHLLWALLHMKQYNTEELSAAIVGTTEKTF